MPRYRLVRHPLVERDISRIASHLLEYTTPRSVAAKISALDATVNALAENPWQGTRRDEVSPGLRAIPGADKGVIAFEVREESRTVRILSVTWGDTTGSGGSRSVHGITIRLSHGDVARPDAARAAGGGGREGQPSARSTRTTQAETERVSWRSA